MIAVSRRWAKARPVHAWSSRVSSSPVKTGTSLQVSAWAAAWPSGRVDVVVGGQPFEELLQGAVLVAGVGVAVPVREVHHPPLDVLAVDLLPAGPASLSEQVGGGELHRLGVGPYPLGGLAVMSQDIEDTAILRKGRGVRFGQPDGLPVGW